jgi:hypothetical protein
VLLLSFPGVNVVSAADFAGEMGPITNYLSAKSITGRAGLFPYRSQSDQVDRPNGALVRCANHLLRAAIMTIADNLIGCNHYFRLMSKRWKAMGRDARANDARVACRFCRIAFQIVAGRRVFRHPGIPHRHYILEKLNTFHREHHTSMAQMMTHLLVATAPLPRTAHADEAGPLLEEQTRLRAGRRRGPQLLGDVLPIVLARLGVGAIQSRPSEDVPPAPPELAQRAENAFEPTGPTLHKPWRSLGSPTPDTAAWGHSPDVPVWRDGDQHPERGWLAPALGGTLTQPKNRPTAARWNVYPVSSLNLLHGGFMAFLFRSGCIKAEQYSDRLRVSEGVDREGKGIQPRRAARRPGRRRQGHQDRRGVGRAADARAIPGRPRQGY